MQHLLLSMTIQPMMHDNEHIRAGSPGLVTKGFQRRNNDQVPFDPHAYNCYDRTDRNCIYIRKKGIPVKSIGISTPAKQPGKTRRHNH